MWSWLITICWLRAIGCCAAPKVVRVSAAFRRPRILLATLSTRPNFNSPYTTRTAGRLTTIVYDIRSWLHLALIVLALTAFAERHIGAVVVQTIVTFRCVLMACVIVGARAAGKAKLHNRCTTACAKISPYLWRRSKKAFDPVKHSVASGVVLQARALR